MTFRKPTDWKNLSDDELLMAYDLENLDGCVLLTGKQQRAARKLRREREAIRRARSVTEATRDDELYGIWTELPEDEKLERIARVATCLNGEKIPQDDEEARILLLRALLGDA